MELTTAQISVDQTTKLIIFSRLMILKNQWQGSQLRRSFIYSADYQVMGGGVCLIVDYTIFSLSVNNLHFKFEENLHLHQK